MRQIKPIESIKILNFYSTMSGMKIKGRLVYPFIVVKDKHDEGLINHESTHWWQVTELIILTLAAMLVLILFGITTVWWLYILIPISSFYVLYVLNYVVNRLRLMNHVNAYRNISFEKEGKESGRDVNYLKNRRPFDCIKFI